MPRSTFVYLISLAVFLGGSFKACTQKLQKPNILLIVSEDNGPHLSSYGDPNIFTPALDDLALSGVRFTNAYVTQAGCSPSRSSILTGLYPHQNGQIGLATHSYTMYKDWANIPASLKKNGYRTGIIGKLHVNPESAFPFDFNWNEDAVSDRDVQKIAQVANSFMESSSRPFFLMVNYSDAHVPFLRQQNGIPKNPLQAEQVTTFPAIGIDTKKSRESVANYYNCMKRLDTGIGLLLDQLQRTGKRENTLVIYLSDHGPQLARGKMTSYEFGIKIPMIFHWPGVIEQEQVRDELISTIDLFPTLLDAINTEIPAHLPGRSLLPLLKGEFSKDKWREYLFTEYTVHFPLVYFPQRTVRNNRYKLIVNYLQDRANPLMDRYIYYDRGITRDAIVSASPEVQEMYKTFEYPPKEELYDLQEDPNEYHNLIDKSEYAGVREELKKRLIEWQQETQDPIVDREKLKKLTIEHDSLNSLKGKEDVWIVKSLDYVWRYPQYFQKFEL